MFFMNRLTKYFGYLSRYLYAFEHLSGPLISMIIVAIVSAQMNELEHTTITHLNSEFVSHRQNL